MGDDGRMKVLLFGAEADRAGARFVMIEPPNEPGADAVKAAVEAAAPALRGHLGSCRVACNSSFAGPALRVQPGDELAIIGLVSGG